MAFVLFIKIKKPNACDIVIPKLIIGVKKQRVQMAPSQDMKK